MHLQTWSALFAGLSGLAAVTTAAVAIWSLIGARSDSRQRTRPVVIATLQKGPSTSHGVIYLTIENVGNSVARRTSVTFDPPLPDYETTDDGQPGVVAPFLRRRYSDQLPTLAPRQTLKNVYSYIAVGHQGNVEPMPDQFTVTVTYYDANNKRKYIDLFPLDCGNVALDTASSPGSGNDPDKRRTQAIEAVVWELWERR